MELVDFVVTFLIGLVWLARKVATFSFKAVCVVAKWIASRNEKAVPGPIVRTTASTSSASPSAKSAPASPGATAGKGQVEDRFEIADRILHVKFGGGWSVTVRVYAKRGVAERQLRCCEPQMAEQLRYTFLKSVFPLRPVNLNQHSLEEVLRDCEVAGAEKAADLLRRLGDPQVEPLKASSEAASVEVAQVEAASTEQVPAAQARPAPEASPQARGATRSSPTAGKRVQGRVVEAGKRPSLNGENFNFEVILETEAGEQEVKRGWHLSELFTQLKVSVGDNVAITDLGRTQIGKDGEKRFKTVYAVERV